MNSFDKERNLFIKNFKEYVENNVDLNNKYYGVSFAPISIYNSPDSEKDGLACIVLGKERDGIYTDKFNFFGGKLDENEEFSKAENICATLFNEVLEECGFILEADKFEKCIVDILYNPIYNGFSLIFVCHITGLSRKLWKSVMEKRQSIPDLEWKYQEMSEIDHIPIEEIQIRTDDISKYVRQNMYRIIPLFKEINRDNLLFIPNLKTT